MPVGDAIRPAILHAFGGLYLDADVECYRGAETTLAGLEIGLQSATAGGKEIINAIMASIPQQGFWLELLHLMAARAAQVSSPWLRDGDQILESTGPEALTAVFIAGNQPGASLPGSYHRNGSHVHVYSLGQWFQPCRCRDHSCMASISQQHQAGILDPGVVGLHRCRASWLTELKARNRRGTFFVLGLVLAALACFVVVCKHRLSGMLPFMAWSSSSSQSSKPS